MTFLTECRILGAAAVLAAGVGAAACGHGGNMPMGPGGMDYDDMGVGTGGTMLMSVSPAGGATGVALDAPLVLGFSYPMATVGTPFVDLHQGDLSAPTVPMHYAWSEDGRTLTCTPDAPLLSHTQYTLHIGGGMIDAQGRVIDMDHYGPSWGGHSIAGGMMSGYHAGSTWGMMASGWHDANGGYGMEFPFTTD